jgi:hypothetical protein
VNAPEGRRATWFALTASLMNLALVTRSLATKDLNLAFGIDRGACGQLPALVIVVAAVGLAAPLAAIFRLGPHLRNGRDGKQAPGTA